jgi:hypothetical protein
VFTLNVYLFRSQKLFLNIYVREQEWERVRGERGSEGMKVNKKDTKYHS